MPVVYKMSEFDEKMLTNVHKPSWSDALRFHEHVKDHQEVSQQQMEKMLQLASLYKKSIQEEMTMTESELEARHVGKQDPKRHLKDLTVDMMQRNLNMTSKTMIDLMAFTE